LTLPMTKMQTSEIRYNVTTELNDPFKWQSGSAAYRWVCP